jgi:hypothetical protein
MSAPARALLKTKARREKVYFEKEGASCRFIRLLVLYLLNKGESLLY